MADLKISADDIQSAIDEYVNSFTSDTGRGGSRDGRGYR